MHEPAGSAPPEPALDLDALVEAAAGVGVALTTAQLATFARYADQLVAWNARLNLTRITSPADIARRHFADALSGVREIDARHPGTVRIVDVGAGAGLPGLALRIARPAWRVTLVESVRKKADFLASTVADLALDGVTVVAARAEDLGREPELREHFDVAVARAVARLATLVELCLPLVRVGGTLIAWKGADVAVEVDDAAFATARLGGGPPRVIPYAIPGVPDVRHLVVVAKREPTPPELPRRPGMPAKRPLSGP
jgi:16S rRNA (guanine527-N7)-methyltransferase